MPADPILQDPIAVHSPVASLLFPLLLAERQDCPAGQPSGVWGCEGRQELRLNFSWRPRSPGYGLWREPQSTVPAARSLQTPALSRVSGGRLWKMGQRLRAGWLPHVPKSVWLFPITEVQNSTCLSFPSVFSPPHSFSPLFSLPPFLPLFPKKKYETSKLLSLYPTS